MNTENKRKTLANCKLSEFSAQAVKIRQQVYEYYHKLRVSEIAKKYVEKYKNEDVDRDSLSKDLISDVFFAMLSEMPLDTLHLIASLAFMSDEEAEELDPSEALGIVVECATSQKVLDFFINAEKLVGKDTDSILPVLIFLKAISLAMNTSESESPQPTNNMNENASVGVTSESA